MRRGKPSLRRVRGAAEPVSVALDAEDSEGADDEVEEEEVEVEEEEEVGAEEGARPWVSSNVNADWVAVERARPSKVQGTMYVVRAMGAETLGGRTMVRVAIKGQSFLLHQIRVMVAAAVLVARGTVPLAAVDMALHSPWHVNFPLAPSQGLVLVQAGFSKNSNKKDYALSPASADPAEPLLMTAAEYAESERFKAADIYARVAADWTDAFVQDWLVSTERFRASAATGARWTAEVAVLSEERAQRELSMGQKEAERIRKNVERFAELRDQDPKSGDSTSDSRTFKHKAFLPNAVATEITRRFGANPGLSVQTVLKALASEVAEGRLSPDLTAAEMVDVVSRSGGVASWRTRTKHRLID